MTTADWINVVLTVATVAMAGGTLYLVKVTQNLVKDTTKATQQADRHHQENLRPFCVIAFPRPLNSSRSAVRSIRNPGAWHRS